MSDPTQPVTPTEPAPRPGPRDRVQLLADPSTWTVVLLLVFATVILVAIVFNAKSLQGFAHDGYARGVITFLISLATMAIAFVLVYQAFFGVDSDNRFRRAREVFTGLMGVLGTIVGFYFGTGKDATTGLTIAPLQLKGTMVSTFVTGGSKPYRYVTTTGSTTGKEKVSRDGWILDTLANTVAGGDEVTVTITDAADRVEKLSQKVAGDSTTKDRVSKPTPRGAGDSADGTPR